MNATTDNEHEELRFAEYVLGVLDEESRAAVAHEIATNPLAAAAAETWQRHLIPLVEDVPGFTPADYVWARIHAALDLPPANRSMHRQAGKPRPDSTIFWGWLSILAGVALAAGLVILVNVPTPVTAPSTVSSPVRSMTSRLSLDDGTTAWTATLDLDNALIEIVAVKPGTHADNTVPELWLIPPGSKPISLGVIRNSGSTSMPLDPGVLARVDAQAVLAVSMEPPAGSPTGQPTGAVVAKGPVSTT